MLSNTLLPPPTTGSFLLVLHLLPNEPEETRQMDISIDKEAVRKQLSFFLISPKPRSQITCSR